jgi:hypothetical protein
MLRPWACRQVDGVCLFFPHPVHRQGVLLRFSKKTPVTLHPSTAVHFPMRSGDEVSLSFATRDEL